MTTYSAIDRTPYVYLIGWKQHNKWYYGRRTAKGCHPSDFWVSYYTSSKYVADFVKIYGEPDVKQIRKTFNDVDKCCVWETTVLTRLNAQHKDSWLNKNNGRRCVGGKPKGSKEKLKTRIKKSESQKELRSLVEIKSGLVVRVKKEIAEKLKLDGTHVHITSGKRFRNRTKEEKERHSNCMKGRQPWNKGLVGVQSAWNRGTARPRCCCVVCGKEVDNANLFKYHKHEM